MNYANLQEFDKAHMANTAVVNAATLNRLGAVGDQKVKVGNATVSVNTYAPTQTVSTTSTAVEMKPDPESLRKANGMAQQARYNPQQAMQILFGRLAQDRTTNPELRAKAEAWMRTGRSMSKQGIKGTFAKIQMKKGEELVGKITPTDFKKVDPSHELRHSLSKMKPASRTQMRLNADSILKRIPKPTVQGGGALTSSTSSKLEVSKLPRMTRAGSVGRGAYNIIQMMTPEGAARLAAQTTIGAVASLIGKAEAPRPSMGYGRRLTQPMA